MIVTIHDAQPDTYNETDGLTSSPMLTSAAAPVVPLSISSQPLPFQTRESSNEPSEPIYERMSLYDEIPVKSLLQSTISRKCKAIAVIFSVMLLIGTGVGVYYFLSTQIGVLSNNKKIIGRYRRHHTVVFLSHEP